MTLPSRPNITLLGELLMIPYLLLISLGSSIGKLSLRLVKVHRPSKDHFSEVRQSELRTIIRLLD